MNVRIIIQRAVRDTTLPKAPQVRSWVHQTLAAAWASRQGATLMLDESAALSLTLRWVKAAEMQTLNRDFRGKDSPTNVLSFDYADYPLGDLVICPEVVRDECQRYQQTFMARSAHMVVHGVLHLLGFDHQTAAEQKLMESIEVRLIQDLGYPHPFK